MNKLIVRYERQARMDPVPKAKQLVISRLSAELFPVWKKRIDEGEIDEVVIAGPNAAVGWRIWVNRDIVFAHEIPVDRHHANEQQQAAWRIVRVGELPHELTSPYSLMQEFVDKDLHYPWRILVVCTLLNRTHGRVARTAIQQLMELCPQPEDLLKEDIEHILQPLGLKNMRGNRLRALTRDYLNRKTYREITGVGPYALDSLDIFCWGLTDLEPTDQWLKPYLEWRRQGGPAPKWDKEEHFHWYQRQEGQ